VANKLTKAGLKCVGVPKTIDNDLGATDYTFGYQTAVQIASDAIDRLHTTAKSHDRVLVCEIMGRHAGWMTVDAGMSGSAHWIFAPEMKGSVEDCCRMLKERVDRGDRYGIVAVAEGAEFSDLDVKAASQTTDSFGHVKLGGVAETLAKEIEKRTGFETRQVVLGHTQRGGSPLAYDRILGTRLGYKGRRDDQGRAVRHDGEPARRKDRGGAHRGPRDLSPRARRGADRMVLPVDEDAAKALSDAADSSAVKARAAHLECFMRVSPLGLMSLPFIGQPSCGFVPGCRRAVSGHL